MQSRFANRQMGRSIKESEERLSYEERLRQQRLLKYFGTSIEAYAAKGMAEDDFFDLLRAISNTAKEAILDVFGAQQTEIYLDLICKELPLAIEAGFDQNLYAKKVRAALGMAKVLKSSLDNYVFAPDSFPYSEQASMVATLGDLSASLLTKNDGKHSLSDIGVIVDTVWACAYEVARNTLQSEKPRDVINFTQSIVKFLTNTAVRNISLDINEIKAKLESQASNYMTLVKPIALSIGVETGLVPVGAEKTPPVPNEVDGEQQIQNAPGE